MLGAGTQSFGEALPSRPAEGGFKEGIMDIRQLEYLVAAAQRGSFTKAAEDLFVTRQALSKAVRNLEHESGRALLLNRDGHLELTEDGRALFDEAEPVVAAYRRIEERYGNVAAYAAVRQTLSVAMAHGTAQSMPERTVDAFRMSHPDILLSIEEVSTEAALAMARSGDSDISLVGSAPLYLGGFDLMLVVETGTYVHVPRTSPLAEHERLTVHDLDGQPFVTFGRRNHLHRLFMETCEEAGVRPNIIMTTSDTDLLVRTAEQQSALFFGFPPHIGRPSSLARVLRPLDLGVDAVFGTYAVKRQGCALSSPARAFWKFLETVEPARAKASRLPKTTDEDHPRKPRA